MEQIIESTEKGLLGLRGGKSLGEKRITVYRQVDIFRAHSAQVFSNTYFATKNGEKGKIGLTFDYFIRLRLRTSATTATATMITMLAATATMTLIPYDRV